MHDTTKNHSARLMELCATQISAAFDEAIVDIDALSQSVLDVARHADELAAQYGDVNGKDVNDGDCAELQGAAMSASARLQFADRLSQRLSNVSKNLASLAEMLQTNVQPISNDAWMSFLGTVRAQFTMEQERAMFDTAFKAESKSIVSASGDTTCDELVLFD